MAAEDAVGAVAEAGRRTGRVGDFDRALPFGDDFVVVFFAESREGVEFGVDLEVILAGGLSEGRLGFAATVLVGSLPEGCLPAFVFFVAPWDAEVVVDFCVRDGTGDLAGLVGEVLPLSLDEELSLGRERFDGSLVAGLGVAPSFSATLSIFSAGCGFSSAMGTSVLTAVGVSCG